MEYSWVVERYKQKNPDPIPVENHQCNLVGGSGLIVQMILGFLSFTVLVYKRIQEKPQRPFKIWLLDSAKQVLSSLFAHLANMIFSIILTQTGDSEGIPPPHIMSNHGLYIYGFYSKLHSDSVMNLISMDEQNDPCNYYFITVTIDTSIGVFLACFLLLQLDNLLKRKGFEQLRTGNYYKETKVFKKRRLVDEDQNVMNIPMEDVNYIEIDYVTWLIQLAIWLSITFMSKMILFYVQAIFKYPLGIASYCLLFWLNNFPVTKLVFVMIIVPTIMNGIQFWIQDNVLKKKSYAADTEDIEEEDEENEDVVIRKNFQLSEMYANEEQYSTQLQRQIERRDSKILQNQSQAQQLHISMDQSSQLHNISFSKNYNENRRKDSITYAGSEIPHTIFQVGQKGDTVQVHEDDHNSQMNKGFILSTLNTPINSELLEATSNAANQGANKISKFSQFKDIQFDRSPTTESMAKDFTSSNLLKIQQQSQVNQIQEEQSNLSASPQKNPPAPVSPYKPKQQ